MYFVLIYVFCTWPIYSFSQRATSNQIKSALDDLAIELTNRPSLSKDQVIYYSREVVARLLNEGRSAKDLYTYFRAAIKEDQERHNFDFFIYTIQLQKMAQEEKIKSLINFFNSIKSLTFVKQAKLNNDSTQSFVAAIILNDILKILNSDIAGE